MARTFNYGAQVLDANHNPIPTGTGIKTSDVSDTPKTSPLSYSNTILALKFPSNAADLVIRPSTDLRVSELSDVSTYYVVPSGTTHTIPGGRSEFIYIVRDSADGTANFVFHLV